MAKVILLYFGRVEKRIVERVDRAVSFSSIIWILKVATTRLYCTVGRVL